MEPKNPKEFVELEYKKNLFPIVKKEIKSLLQFVVISLFISFIGFIFIEKKYLEIIMYAGLTIFSIIILRFLSLLILKPNFRKDFFDYLAYDDD